MGRRLSLETNELVGLDLIVERDGGFAAHEDVLLNLLPLVVRDQSEEADVTSGRSVGSR